MTTQSGLAERPREPLRTNWAEEAGRGGSLAEEHLSVFRAMDELASVINDQQLPVESLGVRNVDGELVVLIHTASDTDPEMAISGEQKTIIADTCGTTKFKIEPQVVVDAD